MRELYILSGSRTVCCGIYAVLLPPPRLPFHRELQTESGTRQMTRIFIVFILCSALPLFVYAPRILVRGL